MKKLICLFLFLHLAKWSVAQTQLDQSNSGNDTTNSWVNNSQSCMQTFKCGMTGTLKWIIVDIQIGDCPYPLICKILDGGPGSNVIASEQINTPTNTSRSLWNINFSSPPNLSLDSMYTISLSANCINSIGQTIVWYKSVNNNYQSGQAYNLLGSNINAGDTLTDFYFQTMMNKTNSIKDLNIPSILFYPNPSHQQLVIENMSIGDRIVLKDVAGSEFYNAFSNQQKEIIDISFIQRGIYFLEVSGRSRGVIKKVIVN